LLLTSGIVQGDLIVVGMYALLMKRLKDISESKSELGI